MPFELNFQNIFYLFVLIAVIVFYTRPQVVSAIQNKKNSRRPIKTISAEVISKRKVTSSGTKTCGGNVQINEDYFISFDDTEFSVPKELYESLNKGDNVNIKIRGTQFIGVVND